MKRGDVLLAGAVAALVLIPLSARAGVVQGTTTGSTASDIPAAGDPNRDDVDTATTLNIGFYNYCSYIVNGASAIGTSFVFAGVTGVGLAFKPIDASDITVSNYQPWVVNSNDAQNNIVDPSGHDVNRDISDRDIGGANIVISYKPTAATDPTRINFVQAYVQSFNGGPLSSGTIDRGSSPTPYYNGTGTSGTGNNDNNTVPLVTSRATARTPAVSAWMADVPDDCESGGVAANNCAGPDDTITSSTVTFQTFIESDQVYRGQTYHVLYGGIQWGYTYTTEDVPAPEPSTLALFGAPLAGLALRRWRRVRGEDPTGRAESRRAG